MFEWNKDNRQMFLDKINQYDKIVTFNGEAYDLPILKNHNIDIPHWRAIDLYVLYKKKAALIQQGGFKSYSLRNLVKEIGVETDGKGEKEPSGPNTTAEGKANNRRVEFIKL